MSVLLYAVTDAERADMSPPPERHGLGERPLRALSHEDLRAIVSDVTSAPPTDEASLWDYEAVMEELMHDGAVVPARFATLAENDDEIVAMLAERRDELRATLEEVRDAVEFALHLPDRSDDHHDDPENPGTAYMNRLLAQSRVLEDPATGLAGLIRAHTPRGGTSHACLVEREHVQPFLARTEELGLTVTGPWPPYSFVASPS